jgi:hypothetical protein
MIEKRILFQNNHGGKPLLSIVIIRSPTNTAKESIATTSPFT